MSHPNCTSASARLFKEIEIAVDAEVDHYGRVLAGRRSADRRRAPIDKADGGSDCKRYAAAGARTDDRRVRVPSARIYCANSVVCRPSRRRRPMALRRRI